VKKVEINRGKRRGKSCGGERKFKSIVQSLGVTVSELRA
jgi:hypothetical protein